MSLARLAILVVLTALAVGVALVLQRRRPDPPSAPSYKAPVQLDRADFIDAPGRFLIVLFSSLTCDTCPRVWTVIESLMAEREADDVAFQRIDVQDDSALHQRYRIDGVPTTVIVDTEGVVQHSFFGPVTADELATAVDQAV